MQYDAHIGDILGELVVEGDALAMLSSLTSSRIFPSVGVELCAPTHYVSECLRTHLSFSAKADVRYQRQIKSLKQYLQEHSDLSHILY